MPGESTTGITFFSMSVVGHAIIKAMRPPMRQMHAASIKNCSRMVRFFAPMALRTPISRVRSATETNMMFMMPMPPTNSDKPVMNKPTASMVPATLWNKSRN